MPKSKLFQKEIIKNQIKFWLVLKPGTGTGTISQTRNRISRSEKILKPGIRNQKIMYLKPGTKIVKKNTKTKTRIGTG
jgi:hypothetical protein